MIPAPFLDVKRSWLAAAALGAGFVVFLTAVGRHVPLGRWLFFHYLQAALLALLFAVCCLAAGHAVVRRVLGRTLPLDEHVAIAFPIGVLVFFVASFGFGVLGLYGAAFFVFCPALLLIVGGPDSLRTVARFGRHCRAGRVAWDVPWRRFPIFGFGLLGLVALWLTILTPRNPSVDARWYHLPIAEHYVAAGAIRPFSEGWVPGAFPQLASLLYAWPFSIPHVNLFDRVEAAAHLELAIFLFTLLGITAVVRRLSGERSALAWAAIWLFPGIFCYDSGLVLGADHIAALWAAPLCLLSLRYWEAPSCGFGLLLGAVAAGAVDTKYTAVILLPLPLATVAYRTFVDLNRRRTLHPLMPAGATLAALIALTAPHWLKNLVFYGDPLFPVSRHWLATRFWSPAAEAPFRAWFTLHRPAWGATGLVEMLKTLVTFSFVPHDFSTYHGDRPVFGSLFTLCTPLVLLLRQSRRLLWVFAAAYLGIALWFWIHQFDRYLQVLVPWMVAGTAVVIGVAWRRGGWLRAAIAGLVGLQIVWGADVMFIPSHHAAGGALPKVLADLFASTNSSGDRFVVDATWEEMGKALPPRAKVLVHEEEVHLGLHAESVLDCPGDQGLLYWGEPGATSPAEIWRQLRRRGVTHLVWASRTSHESDTAAGALAFFEFATRYARPVGSYGGFTVAALDEQPPPATPTGLVAYYPCPADRTFKPGLYPLAALARSAGDLRARSEPTAVPAIAEAIERARYLLFDARCHGRLPDDARVHFELLAARGQAMLLLRRPSP